MKRLLNRDQIFLISEKAAEASNTAGGVLANLAMKPISLLIGSIKNGLRKQQLEILAMQWAGEYAKAVQPIEDNQSEVQPLGTDSENESTDEVPNIDDVVNINIEKPVETTQDINAELQKDLETINSIASILEKLPSNGTLDDAAFKNFKQLVGELETIYFEEYMNDLRQDIPEQDLNSITSNIKTYNTFVETMYNTSTAAKLKEVFTVTFKSSYGAKLKEVKEILTKLRQQFTTVLYILKKKQSEVQQKTETQQTTSAAAKPISAKPTVDKATIDKQKADLKKALSGGNLNNEMLSFKSILKLITEARFIIPKEPNELISELDLKQILQENPKIRIEATKRLNYIRLDILQYEAQFILNKSKTKGADGKPGESNAELQRVWDLAIKKINDYFQSVIDVDTVMKKVKPQADEKTKQRIAADDAQLTNLENMNITEVFKVGERFNPDKVYAFDCTVTGLKSVSTTLLVTPTTKFVDDNNDTTVYWFKLLGAYRYDEKSKKPIKLQIFKSVSSNQKLIDNTSYTYLGMRNLRPSTNSGSFAFIYSNFGNIYYNNSEFKDTDEISNELKNIVGQGKFSDKAKNLMKTGNAIRVKMNQRFIVNDEDINANKFPGIDINSLNDDKNIDKAKSNNSKLMNILETPTN